MQSDCYVDLMGCVCVCTKLGADLWLWPKLLEPLVYLRVFRCFVELAIMIHKTNES